MYEKYKRCSLDRQLDEVFMEDPLFLTKLSSFPSSLPPAQFLSVENLKHTRVHSFFCSENLGLLVGFLNTKLHLYTRLDGIFYLAKLYWRFTLLVQLLSKSIIKSAVCIVNCFCFVTSSARLVSASLLVAGCCFHCFQRFFSPTMFCLGLNFLWEVS